MLKKLIKEDLDKSLHQGDSFTVGTLRMLLSVIGMKEKEKRYKIFQKNQSLSNEELEKQSDLTDEEMLDVISSEIKKRKEAILLYEKGTRLDLVDKEKREVEILQRYLPPALSDEELTEIIKDTIKELNAKDIKDLGKVIGAVMKKTKSRAEGSRVSSLVKELLTRS